MTSSRKGGKKEKIESQFGHQIDERGKRYFPEKLKERRTDLKVEMLKVRMTAGGGGGGGGGLVVMKDVEEEEEREMGRKEKEN